MLEIVKQMGTKFQLRENWKPISQDSTLWCRSVETCKQSIFRNYGTTVDGQTQCTFIICFLIESSLFNYISFFEI